MNATSETAAYSAPEMVATIIESAYNGTFTGIFGSVSTAPLAKPGTFKVELAEDRGTFLVRRVRSHWHVTHRGFTGVDARLEDAAWLALNH